MTEQAWIVASYQNYLDEVDSWKQDHEEAAIIGQLEGELTNLIRLNIVVCNLYRSSVIPQLMSRPSRWAPGKKLFRKIFVIAQKANRLFARLIRQAEQAGFSITRKDDFHRSRKDILDLLKHFRKYWPTKQGEFADLRQAMADIKQGRFFSAEDFLHEIENRPH